MKPEKSPEDEAFDAITQSQMKKENGAKGPVLPVPTRPDPKDLILSYYSHEQMWEWRNAVLEEVAQEFDKMTALGDTAASFAAFVRAMKR